MKYPLLIAAALAVTLFSARAGEQKKDAYPLTTCVVSGEKLGEMGEPYIFQYEGREVRFCCKKCRKDFLKEPATYLKKIDDATAKTTATAPTPAPAPAPAPAP